MRRNQITDAGVKDIGMQCAKLTKLNTFALNLQGTMFGDEGAKGLAQYLSQYKSLTSLALIFSGFTFHFELNF